MIVSTPARFAKRRELRRRFRRRAAAWFPLGHLPPWPAALTACRRLRAGPVPAVLRGPLVYLPAEDLARHVLVEGLTGAHKTTALTLPALFNAAAAGVSVVAFDLKYGERDSLAGAAPAWWRHGRDVLVFAPLEASSMRWSPLATCRSLGDAYDLAVRLFPDYGDEPDAAYWSGVERHVCAALAWALVSDGGGGTMGRLRDLAEAGPAAVLSYGRAHPDAAVLLRRLGAYHAMLPKDQAGILQGIAARLEAWTDERVLRATTGTVGPVGWDEIDLERLRRIPTLLVIGVPQAALPRLRILCQLLMRALAACLLRPRTAEDSVPVLYVLEELPAWGAVPGLADFLATCRSRGVALLATLQSEAQGESAYGRTGWAAVAANFLTKIYFGSLADADAERLSRALGTTVIDQISRTTGWGGRGRQMSEHTRRIEVPLARPEALQGAAGREDEIIVRSPRLPPARLWCLPFHLRPEYAGCTAGGVPSTLEITLRHRIRRGHPGEPVAQTVQGAPAANDCRPRNGDRSTVDDTAALAALIRAVLDRETESDTRNHAQRRPQIVCRGGRAVELRIEPETAFRLLGGAGAGQEFVRRWAAHRWVKQVRPVFVLERSALEALDDDLRQRLYSLERQPS
jgi:type IV secretory pathway TraG/TraD family ATPase VirD4